MLELVAYAAVGLGTYFMRSLFILSRSGSSLPPVAARALKFVGPAVLSSLVAVAVADGRGIAIFATANPESFGLLAAVGVAWWKGNVILTIVVGVAVVWLL